MKIGRSMAKWFAVNFSLRGIPERKLLVNKFFDVYLEARAERERLIRNIDRSQQDGKFEISYALGVRSRAMFPISLQTASIAMCNCIHGKSLVDIVANQMLAYGEATIMDDFHDEVLVRCLSRKEFEDIDQKYLYNLLREPVRLEEISLTMGTFKRENGETVFSKHLLNAALRQADIYEERMSSRTKAYQTYLKARDELYKIQALSLLISIALRRGKIEKVLQLLGGSEPGYEKNVVALGNKLALIGQENAAIVFEATQPQDIDEEKAEFIKENLRRFYHGSTLLKQFTEDDSLRLPMDLEDKAENLWALLTLRDNHTLSVASVRNYLTRNPQVVSEVLLPCIREMRYAFHWLRELEFGVSDLRLAISLVTRQAERDMKRFERMLGTQLDNQWLLEAEELIENAV